MCADTVTQAVCFLLLLVVATPAGHTVRIQELRVPEVIRRGSSALLDCDYTLEGVDHNGLVVKWYFNDPTQSRPVYQWIPGTTGPQGLGPLRGKLNLGYRASQDARTWHRALHIPQPQAEMSGEYTCVVSTFENEDRQTKRMIVFGHEQVSYNSQMECVLVPERSLRLRHGVSDDGASTVACTAEGIYPQPEMAVRLANEEVESTTVVRREHDGLFDISAVARLPSGALDAPAEFACELRVPQANYTVRRESVWYPGTSTANFAMSPRAWMSLVSLLLPAALLGPA